MTKVNLIYPQDRWILQKIGEELTRSRDIEFSGDAEITYYVNWVFWKLTNGCRKSKCDVILFTHLEQGSDLEILRKADWVFCMSGHGKREISGIVNEERIRVIEGFGTAVPARKIRLGIPGRRKANGRKGEREILQLHGALARDIFEFVFAKDWKIGIGRVANDFYSEIDYLLIASIAEGGPMDCLNAYALNIPVISRDIGFISDLKDQDDIIYENYDVLIHKLKQIEEKVRQRKKRLSVHTWDNFREWHRKAFEEIGSKIN